MGTTMSMLNNFELLLPQLPTADDWSKIIDNLEGPHKESVIVQAKGYNLLSHFQEQKATTERIGWLNIWSKSMTALESAISAFEYGSDWVLQNISRSSFEWLMHVHVLIEPISDLVSLRKSNSKVIISKMKNDDSFRKTVLRLRAYAAWCLWSDKELYKREYLDSRNMAKAWDPNPAINIFKDKASLEKYERFFGKLISETDKEILSRGRKEMELRYKKKVERIEQWLESSELKAWADKIQDLSRNKGGVSFFNLFNSEATMSKQLSKLGIRFGYCLYSEGSMALHGSTMDQFIHVSDSVIAPKRPISEHGDEKLFAKIVSDCNSIFVLLGMINDFALRNPKLRT